LASPTTPTASSRKLGKVHPNLVSAINAAYNSDTAEESSGEVDGSHGIAGRNEAPLRGLQQYIAEDDAMAVDSGARVTKQSSRSARTSSSSEEDATYQRPVSKSRTANRNPKARSRKEPQPPDTTVNPRFRLRDRDKLAHDMPRLLIPPVLKRKREDNTENSHLHVIDLTGDLEDEVWLRII
jgi:hypothetical protein